MRTQDNWHKRAIKTKDQLHWNTYRLFHQEVKREIRLAEIEHVRTELESSNRNSNSIWKVLNRCLPRKEQPLSTTEDPFSQANKFNKFYTAVSLSAASRAKTVAEEHNFQPLNQESNRCSINGSPQDDQCPLFEFQSVTDEEVQTIIRSLPSNKAPGLDKVTARVLKDSLPATLSVITSLINSSFSSKTFAQVWKLPEVIPLVKSGDADEPSDTRPISLPIVSKVCKRAAHSQFVNFLHQNGKISKLQDGNRKLHSTETALLYFTDEILKNMDDKKVSVIVLLDVSKVFDSIRHDLMSKLRSIRASNAACNWFESYLSQRNQVVNIANCISDPLPLTVGVPQGSILGPVLFTLYVNYLLSVPRHCQAMGYVDDTKIFLSLPPSQIVDAVTALNKDLSDIARWCCMKSHLINPDKTKFLVIEVPQLMRALT